MVPQVFGLRKGEGKFKASVFVNYVSSKDKRCAQFALGMKPAEMKQLLQAFRTDVCVLKLHVESLVRRISDDVPAEETDGTVGAVARPQKRSNSSSAAVRLSPDGKAAQLETDGFPTLSPVKADAKPVKTKEDETHERLEEDGFVFLSRSKNLKINSF